MNRVLSRAHRNLILASEKFIRSMNLQYHNVCSTLTIMAIRFLKVNFLNTLQSRHAKKVQLNHREISVLHFHELYL